MTTNALPYNQAVQFVAAIVPDHIVIDGANRWYDYAGAVAAICAALNHAADGSIANFIDGMVADAVENTYGVLLPDWRQRTEVAVTAGIPPSDKAIYQ